MNIAFFEAYACDLLWIRWMYQRKL